MWNDIYGNYNNCYNNIYGMIHVIIWMIYMEIITINNILYQF